MKQNPQIKFESTGIILSGGKSERFQANKAFADWQGERLITVQVKKLKFLFPKIFLVTKTPELYKFLEDKEVSLVKDQTSSFFAMGGIYSGLMQVKTSYAFVSACDMPLIQPDLIRFLWESRKGYKAVVPMWKGFFQPLCAFYSKDCLKILKMMIEKKSYKLNLLFEKIPTRFIKEKEIFPYDPKGLSFEDIDTPSDYERIQKVSLKPKLA
ncbi:MAG: molybdenum cofactor guanylyltransferase [Elusimicrobia bacterium]|nr:molybdenum cofactor guanylyltransferase [Elusimicrobiota bacterium]